MTGVVVDLVSYYVTDVKVKIISVFQSSVGRKWRLYILPQNHSMLIRTQRNPYFCSIISVIMSLSILDFKILELFCSSMSVVKCFER